MVFWCIVMGGRTEWSVTSGGTVMTHESGKYPTSGSFLHHGGTITFQILSGSPGSYSIGWGSMVDDTDPSHFKIVPAVPPDPAMQGAMTGDYQFNPGGGIQAQPGQYGSPNLNMINGPDSNTQTPSGSGGLNQDGSGSYWGGWVVWDSQYPGIGAYQEVPDPTKLGAGYMYAYENAQVHLLIIPKNPWPTTLTYYEGSPWGTFDHDDERTDLIQAHYDDEQNPIPTYYSVLEQGVGNGQHVTLMNSLDITQDAQGNTEIWYVSRQGLVRGRPTQYQYMGFPMQQGALRMRTASGWKTIGNARFSSAQAGWNPANPNTGGGPDDPNGYDYNDAYVGALKILVDNSGVGSGGSGGSGETPVDVYSMGLTSDPTVGPTPAADFLKAVSGVPYGVSTTDALQYGQGPGPAPYPGGQLKAISFIENGSDAVLGFSLYVPFTIPSVSALVYIKVVIDGTDAWAADLTRDNLWRPIQIPLPAGSHDVQFIYNFGSSSTAHDPVYIGGIALYPPDPTGGTGGTGGSGALWVTEQPAYWGSGTPLYLRTDLGWEMVALFGPPAEEAGSGGGGGDGGVS